MALTRARKVLLSVVLVLATLVGAAFVLPPLLWGDGVDYSHATSIKKNAEYQDAALLAKAWALPVAALYRSGVDYQNNGSFCGPTSVVNVMHSIHLGADQKTILAGTAISPFMGILLGGITLDQLADVARSKVGKNVSILRDIDLATFREHIRRTNDPSRRYLINFHRGPLFATGGGHHSPVIGYLADEDLVFVLDVNKKYGPWLAKPERLYEAMNTVDPSSHQKRGMLVIE